MKYSHLKSGTDIRGVALGDNITLSPEIAGRCAGAFSRWLQEKTGHTVLRIAVGADCRKSSPDLQEAVCRALKNAGNTVLNCQDATTPSMFFATQQADCDGAIEITASHLPPERNGLKFFTKEGGLEGADIAVILQYAEQEPENVEGGAILPYDIMTPYSQSLREIICERTGKSQPFAGLKIIVNAGNGMGGFFASQVLAPLGADTTGSVNLTPDGTFPVHIPNPESKAAMDATAAAVRAAGADFGICFDTDCDRAGLVDQAGKEINSNRLIALISAILLEEQPGITVVTDSVTSTGLSEFITAHGGKHHRFKRGYKNVIDEAKRLESVGICAPLAIETSGHAALKENHYLDDGAYLIVRLLCAAAKGGQLSDKIKSLPEAAEAMEIRPTITEEDFKAYGQQTLTDFETYIQQFGTVEKPSFEGVRVNFDKEHGDGWCLMRLSVHDPVLPINIESNRAGGCAVIEQYIREFLQTCPGIR